MSMGHILVFFNSIDTAPQRILWKSSKEGFKRWPFKIIKHFADTSRRVATQYPFSKISRLFTDFPDFRPFSRPFERPILAIFIHQQFENFVQIFMHADLIFNEKSQTINIRKGMFLNINCLAICVQKHSVSNIACIYGK